ncbi:NAD(P)-dependent dehydrogenase, short-chain alcohol dehydrogenase family [Sphingobium faniae]|nr:NAD(P)-dependent dehydrogenase, short-chain alcohol dehydrogenase family [Sphingobium faniae]
MLCEGKTALVTGAGSGIGRAAAIAFAREGAQVCVADIDLAKAESVAAEIAQAGGSAFAFHADVTSEEHIIGMVSETERRFGGLDLAFNNAGMSSGYKNILDCTEAEWDRMLRTNVTSVWRCMFHQVNAMLRRGGGAICNNSSRSGEATAPNMFAYTATKHAVVGITRSAAVDLARQNIRVNALMPGNTRTPQLEAAVEGLGVSWGLLEHSVPMKRIGTANEQAEAVVWLCSDRSSHVTGITLAVDGGMGAQTANWKPFAPAAAE